MDAGPRRDCYPIGFAIDADASAPRSFRKQAGALDHSVVAAIDMQPQSEHRRVVCIWEIRGSFSVASEEGVIANQTLTVAVDGVTEQLAPIDGIADILQRGQTPPP